MSFISIEPDVKRSLVSNVDMCGKDVVIPLISSIGTGVIKREIKETEIGSVFFGLNDDGYFVAYIPLSWAIEFDTDIVYGSPTYGCLEIIY